jgi:mRNA interferase YafQ
MFVPVYSTRFLKDLKRCEKRGKDIQKLGTIIRNLENEIPLDPKHKVHPLQGDYKGYMECHIEPDWLLIYLVHQEKKEVYIVRTGTHADLF